MTDLGIDVPAAKIVDTVKEKNLKIVALSGVLTLAIDSMKATAEALKAAGLDDVKLIVGGAPITAEACRVIGVGFMIVFSMLQVFNGIINDSASIALGTTLILIGNQLGIFISNYFILAAHAVFRRQSDIESAFLGAIIVFAVFAVLSAVRGVIVPKEN